MTVLAQSPRIQAPKTYTFGMLHMNKVIDFTTSIQPQVSRYTELSTTAMCRMQLRISARVFIGEANCLNIFLVLNIFVGNRHFLCTLYFLNSCTFLMHENCSPLCYFRNLNCEKLSMLEKLSLWFYSYHFFFLRGLIRMQ